MLNRNVLLLDRTPPYKNERRYGYGTQNSTPKELMVTKVKNETHT